MKIQANSRQIPSSKTVTSNKKYYDILYSLLQEKSHPDIDDDGNPVRYLDKKK